MAVTKFSEVYDFFFSKIKAYDDFISLEEDELKVELTTILRTSLARIFEISHLTLDLESEEFNVTITDLEKEILALGMVSIWVEQKINNVENFEQFLSTKDYSLYSQANHLKELVNVKSSIQSQQRNLLMRYSTRNFIKSRGV